MTPLLIAALALGGVATVGTAAIVLASPAKKPAPAADRPFGDPDSYFSAIQAESAAIEKFKSDRAAENDARIQNWKKAAKLIPYIGDYAGYLFDLGNWLGKVLGSNYAEQNSPEDLQRAADDIASWLKQGFVPPKPQFGVKDGAKNFADYLEHTLSAVNATTGIVGKALLSLGLMSISQSGKDAMKRGIIDASNGNGSLRLAGWYEGKLKGAESIIAGIAASVYPVTYDAAFQYARKVCDEIQYKDGKAKYVIDASAPWSELTIIATVFTQTMKVASRSLTMQSDLAPKASSSTLTVAGCSCERPALPRTKGFFS